MLYVVILVKYIKHNCAYAFCIVRLNITCVQYDAGLCYCVALNSEILQ